MVNTEPTVIQGQRSAAVLISTIETHRIGSDVIYSVALLLIAVWFIIEWPLICIMPLAENDIGRLSLIIILL